MTDVVSIQADLLDQLKKPDIERAVRRLYDFYFEGIIAQICANGGTQEDGADIFQEAVVVLIEKVKTGQFRGESSLKTFLSAIARNLWLFELRTRGRRKKRETLFVAGESLESPAEMFPVQTNGEALQKVMVELGETCKKILTGFYYEDKSMRELLTEFNYENEQVLRNRKSKCMKKLKELIFADKKLLENLKTMSLYES
jgi:RNA polymerase sigma factor (sigma-70 family)